MTEELAVPAGGPPALVTPEDHAACRRLANLAGRFLLHARERRAADLESTVDSRAQDLILSHLARAFPDDPVLAEEAPPDAGRLGARRVWIVDPLDGTREYHEPGRSDWAVHVALAVDGTLAAGAVALPARGITLATDNPVQDPRARTGRLVVSRSRPTPETLMLGEKLGLDVVQMGSAGAKAMSVVLGEADVYAHAGGQYEWDSAAPAAVALAAGLHASRLDGSQLRYGRPDPWLPDLLICRSELADSVIGAWLQLAA